MRLHEDGGNVRINASRDIHGGAFARLLPQLGRILGDGDGVQIDDAIEAVVVMLHFDPLLQRAEVVADGEVARGLDAGQDSRFGCIGHVSMSLLSHWLAGFSSSRPY